MNKKILNHRKANRKYKEKNRERLRKESLEYYYKNQEKTLADRKIKWKEDFEWKHKRIESKKKWLSKNPKYYSDYRDKNKERTDGYVRKYQDKHRKEMFDRTNKWRKDNPKKIKAQAIARRKVKIPIGQICVECKKRKATIRHHEDYNKPLEVKFVCSKCHRGKLHLKKIT